MIDAAKADGSLADGQTILEPTSGNTGLALAMVGRLYGHPVRCVLPESVSTERRDLLRFYGVEVILSPGELGQQRRRQDGPGTLRSGPLGLHALCSTRHASNPGAHYRGTGPEILRDCPEITHFVAGLGTGGTLTGVGRFLKEHKPDVKIVAATPHPGDLVQGLRSMEEGYIPPVFDESVLDGRIIVDSRTSFAVTKSLLERRRPLRRHPPPAPAVRTAQRLAERMPRGDIVVLLADGGWKYLSTGLWGREYDDLAADENDRGSALVVSLPRPRHHGPASPPQAD